MREFGIRLNGERNVKMDKTNLVMIGHVDHGKSTLIGRLLYDAGEIMPEKFKEIVETSKKLGRDTEFAFLADNLEEEREDAMTIDIIHTPFKSKYEYTIIDCPGHKEFIKNMLTGASQAEAAVLVLSAKENEGIQEQTKRHLFLASMLGIKQLFVAINKMDTINYSEKRFESLKQELIKILKNLDFSNVFFIPISAKKGDNVFKKSEKMNWYRGDELIKILDKNISPLESSSDKPLRFLVQDLYNVGNEKIVVGKIETGRLKKSSEVLFNLAGQKGIVNSIKGSDEDKKEAVAGENIGITFDEVNFSEIKRGEVVSNLDEKPKVKREFDAEIFLLGEIPLKEQDNIVIRCGTMEAKCRIKIIGIIDSTTGNRIEKKEELDPVDAASIKILTSEPLAIEKFSNIPALGRFLLIKENKIAAAGVIK
jgi:translation elongation factor TU